MALKNRQQIFVALETRENVAIATSTLVDAASRNHLAIDPSLDFNVATIQRRINQTKLTPTQPIAGTRTGRFSFGLELTGTSSIGNKNPLTRPIQACGVREVAVRKGYIGAVTPGATYKRFLHGEGLAVDSAPSTQIGTVIGDWYDGSPVIFWASTDEFGTATTPTASEVLVGMTSGCEATLSADSTNNAGLAYFPASEPRFTMTIGTLAVNVAVGDVLKGATSGAIAIVTHAQTSGSTKTIYTRPQSGTFATSEVIDRITPNADADIGTMTSGTMNISPTMTGALTNDGVWEGILGARGSATMRFPVGDIPTAQFEFQGAYNFVQDGANVVPTAPVYLVPAPMLSSNFQMLGVNTTAGLAAAVAPCLATIEIAMNNDVQQRQCMNAASGVLGFEIVGRSPSITIDPELALETFFPIIQKFVDSQNVFLSWRVQPVSASLRSGRTFWCQVPNAAVTVATKSDRNGTLVRNLTLTPNTGDTAFAIDNDFIIIHDFTVDGTSGN